MGHERSSESFEPLDNSVAASAAAATPPTTSRAVFVELATPSCRFMDAVFWPAIMRSGLPVAVSLTSIPGICRRCVAPAELVRA